jgi:hypothetical protein
MVGFYKKIAIMKKFSLIFLIVVSVISGSFAQNIDDALRYSQLFYNGSARFNSMGGAFTALGGDLSTLSQNPAGIGIFRSSEITITPQLFHIKSNTNLFGNNSADYLYDFNLAQAGIVINFIKKDSETGLITLNVGYSFSRTNNFNQSIQFKGVSDKSSLLDQWAESYSDNRDDNDYEAFLGWSTYLIDSLPGSNTSYGTIYSNYGDNAPSRYGQTINRLITTSGLTGEHSISVGGNYSNKLFFGATFGITRLNFESQFSHIESADGIMPSRYSPVGEGYTDFNYTYYYRNTGTGYSLKLGVIYKPLEILRIGLAFHSPVFFKIEEYSKDYISTYFSDRSEPIKAENDPLAFNYALTTPFRAIAGAALQIKKFAVVSAEYEFIDYGSAKFSETGDDYDYTLKNKEIKNGLKSVSNIRVGAEVRLSKLYFRGGYGHYGKAYESGDLNENLDFNSLSLGMGFREQNVFIDLGYTGLMNPQKYILYSYEKDPDIVTAMSNMSINRNLITVTFGYKFGY